MTTQTSYELTTHSAEETQALGEALGRLAQSGDLILLSGPLGAGKTCLTQGIARGLGIREPVRSPTFVLATEHPGRLVLYHVDLYRIDSTLEAADLGLDDYIEGDGVCVVEWAEKALNVFPKEYLLVELDHSGPETRRLRLTPHGARYVELVKAALSAMPGEGR